MNSRSAKTSGRRERNNEMKAFWIVSAHGSYGTSRPCDSTIIYPARIRGAYETYGLLMNHHGDT